MYIEVRMVNLYGLNNLPYSEEQIDAMNDWHESTYGYKIDRSGILMEKLLRAKDIK